MAFRLIVRIETLEAENRQLGAKMLNLEAGNRQMAARIQSLEAENEQLRARLKANSQNSHLPPSSDGPRKQPAIPRKRGGPKGGKKGHKGDTLKMVANPEETVPCRPTVCSCGQVLEGIEGRIVERRQVFNLPEPKLQVTEYQRLVCKCPCCQRQSSGIFPQGVNAPVQYGSGVKAFTTLLSVRGCLSYQKIQRIFQDLFGQAINESTVYSANQKASCAILHDRDNDGDIDITGSDEGMDVLVLFENQGAVPSREPGSRMQASFSLAANPCRERCALIMGLPAPTVVTVALFDALGRLVLYETLGQLGSGRQQVLLDTGQLPEGLYWCRATAGAVQWTGAVVVAD
ncbi:MAG: IS66 family transposase zinc-finger binding domain-containing protein [Lewinellaceae bacterium]|nr:IS66 family transposase zinc-finger binding domain-containing protein [Lewinellaceae bacterium]